MRIARKLTSAIALISIIALNLTSFAADSRGIREDEIKQWLTYFSSDEFEGRNTYSEGLGLAAGFIAAQLKSWGVRPGGPAGSYFQRVSVLGVKVTNRSSLTVEAGGQSRTFKQGEGVDFPAFVGSKRSFTSDQIEFVGYGLGAPPVHNDFAEKNVRGKVIVYIGGANGPKGLDARYRRLMGSRSRTAIDQMGAAAVIAPALFGRPQGPPPPSGQGEQPDFTTVQKLDSAIAPSIAAKDELLEFLLSSAGLSYAELKSKADQGEPLPSFTFRNVRLTFNLDADYRVIRTQYTRNVIGIIEGSDPKLKGTYVAFGAHYDHVGYSEGEIEQTAAGPRIRSPRGRVNAGDDRIWNGADDDGSGSIAILAIAKAFATGRKPRRSALFVWHAGEERGLLGSRYFADQPTVPIDKIVAQINMDMVGRNSQDKPENANHVFVVGSDRISTELHNLAIDANQSMAKPLALDFEMNDIGDPEQIYYRSDHYSYAAKGIPIVFLFTGLHADYHANTDSADKINYEKMARIAQLAYELGLKVANLDHPPARDNRGPRVGKGSAGKLDE
jgi:hypothetical protein